MAKKLILFIAVFISCTSLMGQEKQWLISFEAGLGAGWWVYDKGQTDTLPQIHRGYDRTHLSFLIPQSISVSYSTEKILLGVQAGRTRLEDSRMVSSDHRRGSFNKYSIAEDGIDYIPITYLVGKIGWHIIRKPRFRLTPVFLAGLTQVRAQHPESLTFSRRIYRAGELHFSVALSPNVNLLLYPRYTNVLFRDLNSKYLQSKHNVYGIGLHAGLELALY
ncbi:MAG: hypothetical protein MRZ79_00590 [Bacteroidia bacterium]|nr:hypothetical protein [Bacteroidia bacterium]